MKLLPMILVGFGFNSCVALADNPSITNLQIIELKDGANPVPGLDPKSGEDGLIVQAWRGNGNAHGYNLYVVMIHVAEPRDSWQLVEVEKNDKDPSGEGLLDTLRDDPLTGEDIAHSVRFAKGRLDGKPATFLFTADRDLSRIQTLYDPVPVSITLYTLVSSEWPIGTTPLVFRKVEEHRTVRKYRNAECALAADMNLPVPAANKLDDDCAADGKR